MVTIINNGTRIKYSELIKNESYAEIYKNTYNKMFNKPEQKSSRSFNT